MIINVRLPKDDPGKDWVEIKAKPGDTIEELQKSIVEMCVEDITDHEMEVGLWRERYYIYLIDPERNIERPNGSITPNLNQTLADVDLQNGEKIALDFQEKNPDTAVYICTNCVENPEVDFRPSKEENIARPPPTHDCGHEMELAD